MLLSSNLALRVLSTEATKCSCLLTCGYRPRQFLHRVFRISQRQKTVEWKNAMRQRGIHWYRLMERLSCESQPENRCRTHLVPQLNVAFKNFLCRKNSVSIVKKRSLWVWVFLSIDSGQKCIINVAAQGSTLGPYLILILKKWNISEVILCPNSQINKERKIFNFFCKTM